MVVKGLLRDICRSVAVTPTWQLGGRKGGGRGQWRRKGRDERKVEKDGQ